MAYKAIIFDIDNTLLDFDKSELRCLEQMYDALIPDHIDRAEFHKVYREINQSLWALVVKGELTPDEVSIIRFAQLAGILGLNIAASELSHYYCAALCEAVFWLPGVEAAATSLSMQYQIAAITNGFSIVQRAKYRHSGLHRFCKPYIVSGEVDMAKPDKRIFDLALTGLALESKDVLMVGDSLSSDGRGARNAKMDFCWINPSKRKLPNSYKKPKLNLRSVAELPDILKLL